MGFSLSPTGPKRPWQGQVEKPTVDSLPAYDPTCYLCPGNERAGGVKNSAYDGIFTFVNDFSALLPDVPEEISTRVAFSKRKPRRAGAR